MKGVGRLYQSYWMNLILGERIFSQLSIFILLTSFYSLNLATLGAAEGKRGGEEKIEGGNLTDLDLTLESDG